MSSNLANRQLIRLSKAVTQKQPMTVSIIARNFCGTSRASAKDDSSSIDYFKFPDAVHVPQDSPKIKIPSLPDSWASLDSKNPVKFGKPKPTDEFKTGDVVHVAGSGNIVSKMSDTEPITKSQSELSNFFESSSNPKDSELEELSSHDKTILTYLFGGVAAWWIIGGLFTKKEEEKH